MVQKSRLNIQIPYYFTQLPNKTELKTISGKDYLYDFEKGQIIALNWKYFPVYTNEMHLIRSPSNVKRILNGQKMEFVLKQWKCCQYLSKPFKTNDSTGLECK